MTLHANGKQAPLKAVPTMLQFVNLTYLCRIPSLLHDSPWCFEPAKVACPCRFVDGVFHTRRTVYLSCTRAKVRFLFKRSRELLLILQHRRNVRCHCPLCSHRARRLLIEILCDGSCIRRRYSSSRFGYRHTFVKIVSQYWIIRSRYVWLLSSSTSLQRELRRMFP